MSDIGRLIKQHRVMSELTLGQLSEMSGVSLSYLGRIERGERFPSARTLRKIAKPLGLDERELFVLADYLSPQSPATVEGSSHTQLDPYVAKVLSEEPVEVQRIVIAILSIFKSIAKGSGCDIGFAEYARRKYPWLDEDTITMIADVIERQRERQRLRRN